MSETPAEPAAKKRKSEEGGTEAGETKPAAKTKASRKRPAAEGTSAAETAPARSRATRRGEGEGVDTALVNEMKKFLQEYQTKKYEKNNNSNLHKTDKAIEAYWTRNACGYRPFKEDGSGRWSAAYFKLTLDNCWSMAANVFCALKFGEKMQASGDDWAHSAAAGEYYGPPEVLLGSISKRLMGSSSSRQAFRSTYIMVVVRSWFACLEVGL